MSKVNDQKWWCENLFANGDFADTSKAYNIGNASGGLRQSIGNPVNLLTLFGEYFYWIYYNVASNQWGNNYVLFSLDTISCKPNTYYTISWWEHIEANFTPKTQFDSANSMVHYQSNTNLISSLSLVYDSVVDFTPYKWYRRSVTIKTPAGCNNFYFQLGFLIKSIAGISSPFFHVAYDGIFVCEGENRVPNNWIDKITGSTDAYDYVYWKVLDKLNQTHYKNEQKWWCENLFANGDFADTSKAYNIGNASGGLRQSIGNPVNLLPLSGEYFYWIYYNVASNQWSNNYVLFSLDTISCKSNTYYTISWWEHIESNVMQFNSSNSKVYYRTDNNAISSSLLQYDSVVDFTPHKWYRRSVTIQTPANCINFYFQLGFKITNVGNNPNPFFHVAYDGMFVCEGENRVPFTWVDKTGNSTNDYDLVYWKTLDKLNQMNYQMHSDIENGIALRASDVNFGTVKLQPDGDILGNNSGQLILNDGIIIEIPQNHSLVSVPDNKLSDVLTAGAPEANKIL